MIIMWFNQINRIKCFSGFSTNVYKLTKCKVVGSVQNIWTPLQTTTTTLFQQQYCYSTIKKYTTTFTQPGHGVYVLTNQNIYINLALEDWLYKNGNFDNGELLLIWRNQPCIVIGRHQNVWAECNVLGALRQGIDIARRRSGGGTVYHDLGNLNCTFFTSRKNYNRKQNLEVIARALRKTWKLNVNLSKRDDLILDNDFKISGTAAKLGRNTAYHHCTLLFDVQIDQLSTLLCSPMRGLESRATESTRSVVKNLCEVDRSVNYTRLADCVISEYLPAHCKNEMKYIDPTLEMQFPGIGKLHNDLKNWDWTYGHSPLFTIRHCASGPVAGSTGHLLMHMTVEKGHIESINLELTGCGDSYDEVLAEVCDSLIGCRFWPMHITVALISLQLHLNSPELWSLLNSCFSGFLEPECHVEHQRNNVST